MDVKGMELGGFDPRGVKGQVLAYAASCHGGDYLTAFMIGPEVLGKPLSLDRLSLKGKAGILQLTFRRCLQKKNIFSAIVFR